MMRHKIIIQGSDLARMLRGEFINDCTNGIITDEVYGTLDGIYYVTIDPDGLRVMHKWGQCMGNKFPRKCVVISENHLSLPHWEIPVRQFAIDLNLTVLA